MAGSYLHAVDEQGRLRSSENMDIATETPGDAYETIEEFYGLVWFRAGGDPDLVENARVHYRVGLDLSPGREPD